MKSGKLFAAVAALLLGASLSFASPSAQKAAQKQGNANSGIPQMPGDNGKIGTIYRMGEKDNELLLTLDSVTIETRFASPDDLFVANKQERLLMVNFSVQNNLPKEQSLGSRTFLFTVVSPDDENYEFRGDLLNGTKKTRYNIVLKQAQKVKCSVIIPIHDSGEIPKLIIQKNGSKNVLRYDLTGKLNKMTSAFAKGTNSLSKTIEVKSLNEMLQVGPYDFKVENMYYTTNEVFGRKPVDGEKICVILVSFTNPLQRPVSVGFQYMTPELIDSNNKALSWNRTLLGETSDAYFSQELAPGETVKGRYYFVVPAEINPTKLRFTHVNMERSWTYSEIPAK
jgi:hypothetical protein